MKSKRAQEARDAADKDAADLRAKVHAEEDRLRQKKLDE